MRISDWSSDVCSSDLGMIMGLGLALTEETLFDERSGRIMNASLADYHIPAHLDVPDIHVIWTGIPDPRSPLGARRIGETGITGVAAAIANAVFNSTGQRNHHPTPTFANTPHGAVPGNR